MTGPVLDFLGAPGTPQQIKDSGAAGVAIYTKMANFASFYLNCVGAGLPTALIEEGHDNSALQGYAEGQIAGVIARTKARAVGHPDSRPIICADFDFDMMPNQVDVCLEYLRGFRDGAGPCAPYGTAFFIDHACAMRYCTFGYQSCSGGYYDNARISPFAALHQHCGRTFSGHDVDENDVLHADWGQHDYSATPPVVHPLLEAPMTTFVLSRLGITEDDKGHNPILRVSDDRRRVEAWYAPVFESHKATAGKVVEGFGIQAYVPHGPLRDIAWLDSVTVRCIGVDGTTFPLKLDQPWKLKG